MAEPETKMTETDTNVAASNTNMAASGGAVDPNALVQEVLREAYLQTTEDLRFYAEKVRYFNQMKKAVREYLSSLREFKANVVTAARARNVNLSSNDKKDMAALGKIFAESAHPYDAGSAPHELSIPNRVPPEKVTSLTQLESEIARWETKLNTIGDDAQLANVDLQNILQKQQQALQMMSNISKMMQDNAMAIIRKIGGG